MSFLAGYIFASPSFTAPDIYLDSLPSTASYVIDTDGTYIWAVRYDGKIACNGTDASTVIQAAVDSLIEGRGKIFFKDGIYLLDTAIVPNPTPSKVVIRDAGIIFEGSGWGTVLASTGTNSVFEYTNVTDSLSYPVIKNMQLRGYNLTRPFNGGWGINFSGGTCDVLIENCWVHRFADGGIKVNGWTSTIWRSPIEQNDNYGIYLHKLSGGGYQVHSTIFDNNINLGGFSGVGYAIYSEINKVNIIGNYIYREIYIDGIDNVILGNTFGVNVPAGTVPFPFIQLSANSRRTRISNNDFVPSATYSSYGIVINSGAENIIISLNHLGASYVSGIILNEGTNVMIINNHDYVTESSGTATITASTTVVFAHGLAGTPTHVAVGFKTTGYGSWIWSADATNITITVANSGTYDLTWDAEYTP